MIRRGGIGIGNVRGSALRRVLVAGQVALALVLLVSAILMLDSLSRLQRIDPGFDVQGLGSVHLELPPTRTGEEQAVYRQLLDVARTTPGVVSASLASSVPLTGSTSRTAFMVEDARAYREERRPEANLFAVAPEFFETLGASVLRGRRLERGDRENTLKVSLVDETLAGRYWPGADPVGKTLWLDTPEGLLETEIVGVVGGLRTRLQARPGPTIFVPLAQRPKRSLDLLVRTAADPAPVVADLGRRLSQGGVLTSDALRLEEHSNRWLAGRRFLTSLLGVLGVAALALASLGVYGVTAYSAKQRSHEIGVRVALGARRSDILQMFLWEGALIVGAGLALGLVLTLIAMRFLRLVLYEVSPFDGTFLVLASLLLAAVSMLAMLLPARTAAATDPAVAFRSL